jgi:type IV pilus assembly protein PilM
MASLSGAVWAIDIGNNSLKALHLRAAGEVVEIIGFDNIQHGKILNGSGVKDAEKEELIAISLRQFVSQNNLGRDDVIVSVPSQNTFARFVVLPPVEKKKVDEIVKFEAAQQIPFDINDVQWDWQLMSESESGERKVGIFAIKNDVVSSALGYYGREKIQVSYVQMSPMALYNYILYDHPELFKTNGQPIVVLNIGAENTDLVVCTASTVWQRCIPMGGNNFTLAIADAFKLNFEKAEKLKRTAPMSKYARQILQAMKPVFTDLASEIQRSLGFYSSSSPNSKLSKIIALGGGTKMQGLLKYLQQTLQMPVERPDSFKKLSISSGISAANFHENVCDFGVVYGLALQVLGLGRIESNLLPVNIARSMSWRSKAMYFTIAACMLLVVSVLSFGRTFFDRVNYADKENARRQISSVISEAEKSVRNLEEQRSKKPISESAIKKEFDLFKYRDMVPLLYETMVSVLPNQNNNPDQKKLYEAFAKEDVEAILQIPRKERKQIFITGMLVKYTNDLATTDFGVSELKIVTSGATGGGPTEASSKMLEMMRLMGPGGPGMGPGGPAMPGVGKPEKEIKEKSTGTRNKKELKADEEEKDDVKSAGFVLTITGYSPYKDLMALMDPSGAGDDKSKWGFVTRLMHLNDFVPDGNSPFELYRKSSIPKQFKLEIGDMSVDSEMPEIGFITTKSKEKKLKLKRAGGGEDVLVDPMTKEIVSKTAVIDDNGKKKIDTKTGKEIYEVNDHWFKLDVKFIWKDAAVKPDKGAMSDELTTTMPASGTKANSLPAAASKKNASKEVAPKKIGKKKNVDIDF